LDVNQTNNPQTLSLFEMLVNGIVVDTYNTTILVPPTAGGGNGNGYADYTFTGFTSLSGYADDAVVEFHAVMSGLNDGREQFFLIQRRRWWRRWRRCGSRACDNSNARPGVSGARIPALAAR
jgi:hypothetical protein